MLIKNALAEFLVRHLRFSFLKDIEFYLALALAPVSLMTISWLMPDWSNGIELDSQSILLFALWQPLLEEVLFRGMIQGQLKLTFPQSRHIIGIFSLANICTTVLFVLAHLLHHPVGWAIAVAMPSLIFGYFRDRHFTLLPCIFLHAAYNACYLVAGSLNNSIGVAY